MRTSEVADAATLLPCAHEPTLTWPIESSSLSLPAFICVAPAVA